MNGILCVNKEKDYTSFDVVAIMRRLTGIRKIGHGGTLDPMAEGVLPIFIGNATKAVDIIPSQTKEYYAGFKLGLTTDTEDITGKILTQNDTKISFEKVKEAENFINCTEQIPPMYSAVKVNGVKLYNLARQGKEIERKSRKIKIYELKIEHFENMQGFIRVKCSKGTYIRTLIHDIGQFLGVGGVMTSLTRTNSSGFSIEECHKLNGLKDKTPTEIEKLLIPVERIFSLYPKIFLDETQTKLYKNGVELDASRLNIERKNIYENEENIVFSVYDFENNFIATAKISTHSLCTIRRFGVRNCEKII